MAMPCVGNDVVNALQRFGTRGHQCLFCGGPDALPENGLVEQNRGGNATHRTLGLDCFANGAAGLIRSIFGAAYKAGSCSGGADGRAGQVGCRTRRAADEEASA